MNADALLLLGSEAIEHLVVERDKTAQQATRRIKLEREAALGKVDLDRVRSGVERAANVGLGLIDEVGDEGLPRISGNAIARVEQAQGRGRDDSLLQRRFRDESSGGGETYGVNSIAKGAGGQTR